ncbi:MAG: DUF72 domain-containing protein [Treponema sp.]|nr:DUF72 domain-containing protein [Candidatus Treponema equifaecale]
MSEILIGTSGYDHPELKGSFYPMDLPRKDFLSFYSTKFNALEINSTFYGMPNAQRMLSFYERSEGRVKFSVKLTRVLTHEIDSKWKENAREFLLAMDPIAEKDVLSTVLIQFPEGFHYTPENRIYLANLLAELKPLPAVVEFRRSDWIRPSVFEGLAQRESSIVFCDMPALKNLPDGKTLGTPFIGKNAYIRLHGRNAAGWYAGGGNSSKETVRYDYEYSESELKSFLPIIRTAQKEGRTVHMYFNNHPKGTGFMNALMMKGLVGESN